MKNLNTLDQYRRPYMGMAGDELCGFFVIPSENGKFKYCVIAVSNEGWDHVSISIRTPNEENPINRCPKWDEMCFIKNLFFDEEETVIQYHPAKKDYINNHPYVLHLWRPTDEVLPTPPTWMIGV